MFGEMFGEMLQISPEKMEKHVFDCRKLLTLCSDYNSALEKGQGNPLYKPLRISLRLSDHNSDVVKCINITFKDDNENGVLYLL